MSAKTAADLTTENAAVIGGQTTPESITPLTDSAFRQDVIDSMWNKLDTPFTLPPINMTKAQLATAISLNQLNDQQQITITDRADAKLLIVFARGVNNISPNGIWINTKPLKVLMDYIGGFEGETNPFLGYWDAAGLLNLSKQIIIADASKGNGKFLQSDASGKGTWVTIPDPAYYQSALHTPGGTAGPEIMMGLNGSITPTKTGKVLIICSGEYKSSDIATATNFNLTVGTGAIPANGDPVNHGLMYQNNQRVAATATERYSFSFNYLVSLTIGVTYWIDIDLNNNASGAVNLYNVSLTAAEQ